VGLSVPAELLRRRPDIRGAEFRAIAQVHRIGIAKAELFPSFELFGSIGLETSSHGGRLSNRAGFADLFSPSSLVYSFGARALWPILSYPRILNNVRAEDARFQQAVVNYQNTVLRAAQEVEDGIAGYLREQEASVIADRAAVAAADAVKLALVQYREGAVDFQRVLDTQRVQLQAQNTLARTRERVAQNLIALYKALGGGWEMRVAQPVVPPATQVEMQRRTNWGRYFRNPSAPPKAHEASPRNR
jgi:outer membrane protein TolC